MCTLCVMIGKLALLRKQINKGQHIIFSMVMMSKGAMYFFIVGLLILTKTYIDKVVVVVNHCFTSLFGTNGLLSDIVIP